MPKYFAMISRQGTACMETVLTEEEYNDPVRKSAAENRARHTPIDNDSPMPGVWRDVSDNDAIVAMMEDNNA